MANDVGVASLPPLKTVRADGRTISYREAGSGTPLLLLHGIGSGAASFETELAEGARRGFRTIAWEAPGYGGSDRLPQEKPATADYAQSAAQLLDALGIQKAHILGHSLGGMMAASFARHYPDRVISLVLVAPAGGYGTADAALRAQKLRERLEPLEKFGPRRLADERSAVLLSPNASPEALAKVREVMAQIRPDGYTQAVYMLNGGDTRGDGVHVRARTLVMCGSADVVTPEKGCRAIADAIPGARYLTLPGLGHCCNVENPALFDDALFGFLKS